MRTLVLTLATASLLLPTAAGAAEPDDAFVRDFAFERAAGWGETRAFDAEGSWGAATRCGTADPLPAVQVAVGEAVALWQSVVGVPVAAGADVEIPVAFHVVHHGNGLGRLTHTDIEAQMAVLNDAFRGTGFTFALDSVDYKRKNNWFWKCDRFNVGKKILKKLGRDQRDTLNVYTCDPGGLLGFVPAFPWEAPESHWAHGVVLNYGTVPGGFAAPYDLGATLVHEVGHYLGLLHTFQNGCSQPGDEVADTPFEAQPSYGCPNNKPNTCPQGGKDPIDNYMDYSDDACLEKFSRGQEDRMHSIVDMFRPALR